MIPFSAPVHAVCGTAIEIRLECLGCATGVDRTNRRLQWKTVLDETHSLMYELSASARTLKPSIASLELLEKRVVVLLQV